MIGWRLFVYRIGFWIGRLFIYYPNTLKVELQKEIKMTDKDIET